MSVADAEDARLPRAYEVSLEVDGSVDTPALLSYMRDKHIPEIGATGCFMHIDFAQTGAHTYRTRYVAPTQAALNEYLEKHAPAFKADFVAHFPAGGISVTRVVWTVQQTWTFPASG
ncbi:DUF4286 family protein [archaeon]|nr:MAG: DUF4286 family protein [archaeon]